MIELDEMSHFLMTRTISSETVRTITLQLASQRLGCDDRNEHTFWRLLERLMRWRVRPFYSDSYAFYPRVPAVSYHSEGQGETGALETTKIINAIGPRLTCTQQ
jgi:IS1 family transposase